MIEVVTKGFIGFVVSVVFGIAVLSAGCNGCGESVPKSLKNGGDTADAVSSDIDRPSLDGADVGGTDLYAPDASDTEQSADGETGSVEGSDGRTDTVAADGVSDGDLSPTADSEMYDANPEDGGLSSDGDNRDAGTSSDVESPSACGRGEGTTLFRFHYRERSRSPEIDAWNASCAYTNTPNSACNVEEVPSPFEDMPRTSNDIPVVNEDEYLRVRFSVTGLQFDAATLYLHLRRIPSAGASDVRVWSPIYGDKFEGPIMNDFDYKWHALDWSSHLSPTDDPDLTAIQIYADGGELAIRAVELCID